MSWDQKLFHWHLKTRRFGREIRFFDEIDSTNLWLAEHQAEFTFSGGVAVADHQTAGRGRQQRLWHDQPGQSLLFSLLLRRKKAESADGWLALLPGIALAEVLHERFRDRSEVILKWPNDVLLNGRKVAGVLGQSSSIGSTLVTVLGMGVNVTTPRAELPAEFQAHATSLLAETGESIAHEILLAEILNHLELLYDEFLDGKTSVLCAHWLQYGPLIDAPIRRQEGDQVIEGTFAGLGEQGQLLLRRKDGTLTELFSGDIELERAPARY